MTWSLDEAAFAAWLDRYKAAWEQRDAPAAAALFTEDASYRETPYDPPFEGRAAIEAYWAKAVAGQRGVRFTSEILACADDRGLCHWHATFTAIEGGTTIDLDGIFHCRFAEPHLVATFEEWWHLKVTAA
jgi:uncharacterized protein (TIGR02246 family)